MATESIETEVVAGLVATTHASRMATIRKIQSLTAQLASTAASAYSTAKEAKTNSGLSAAEATYACGKAMGFVTGTALDVNSFMIKTIDDIVGLTGTDLKEQLKAASSDFT